jgi:hypothetical protein
VKSHLFHIVLAICVVGGMWCTSHLGLPSAAAVPAPDATLAASTAEPDVLDLRTGDTFWGLHLDGVVPCSSMAVRGGGHLVTFSVKDDHNVRCVYQVGHEKQIKLLGEDFRIRVIAPDEIHVERGSLSKNVAVNH